MIDQSDPFNEAALEGRRERARRHLEAADPDSAIGQAALQLARDLADASGRTAEEVLANNSKGVPVGRYGTSEEVANAIVFLCSEAASYINGVAIAVDGGSAGHI